MSATECIDVLSWVTTVLNTPCRADTFRQLRAVRAAPSEFIEAFCEDASDHLAEMIRKEFRELPAVLVSTVIEAWAMAEATSRRFQVRSVPPHGRLAFARRRRVRIAIEAELSQVQVLLSHVPTRHATWYRPAIEAVV